jgi:hypothetical protein
MFKYFCRVAQEIYKAAYCEGDFSTCARRRLRLAGEKVPVSLLPQGFLLWNEAEGEEAPTEFYIS